MYRPLLLFCAFLNTTVVSELINGISHVCVHHLGSFELSSRVLNPADNRIPPVFTPHSMGQAHCHNLTEMGKFSNGDNLILQLSASGENMMKEAVPVSFNASSPMWVTYVCQGNSRTNSCELLREWLPKSESEYVLQATNNNTCAVNLVDREDCGSTGINESSCESKGCCWQELKTNPTNAPWCFNKGFPGGAAAPPNKALPFGPADCFVTAPSFDNSELVLQKDILYGSAVNPYLGGFDKTEILRLDALFPPARDQRKLRPAMVWVHGGAYLSGDKSDDWELRQAMVARGYVVLSIDYRMVSDGVIPAVWDLLSIKPAVVAAQDTRAAVRYLRKHASEWRVDPDRIIIGGESAGAITVDLYGFAKGFTEGASGNAGIDSSINAVLSLSGSMRDLAFCATIGGAPRYQPYVCVISSPPGNDLTKDLSTGDVPVVDLHGTKDNIIPYIAGKEFIDRSAAVGVKGLLLTIPGAGHVPMSNIMDPKEPYLLQWLTHISGALNLATAECPKHAGITII